MRDGQLRDALIKAGYLTGSLSLPDKERPLVRIKTDKVLHTIWDRHSLYGGCTSEIITKGEAKKKENFYNINTSTYRNREDFIPHYVEVSVKEAVQKIVDFLGLEIKYEESVPAKEEVPEQVGEFSKPAEEKPTKRKKK